MNLRFFGDSHIDILADRGPDRWQNDGLVFTLDRLRSWAYHYHNLDSWLRDSRGRQVVLSCGNTDIRAHWWRRSLRTGQILLDHWVEDQAQAFVSVCDQILHQYALARLIILGPPVCSDHIWDGHYPYSGSVSTRNRMVDLWNRAMVDQVSSRERMSYATAFYHYLDPVTWRADPSVMDDDGVHYRWAEGRFILEQVIEPAQSCAHSVPNLDLYLSMRSRHQYHLGWTPWLESHQGYWDSWIFSESRSISETYTRRSTDPNSRDYSLDPELSRPRVQVGTMSAQYVFFDEFDQSFLPYKELELRG